MQLWGPIYLHTVQEKKNSFNNPQKLNNITEVEKKKTLNKDSLSLSLPLPVHDSRDFFASHEVCEERERERERESYGTGSLVKGFKS